MPSGKRQPRAPAGRSPRRRGEVGPRDRHSGRVGPGAGAVTDASLNNENGQVIYQVAIAAPRRIQQFKVDVATGKVTASPLRKTPPKAYLGQMIRTASVFRDTKRNDLIYAFLQKGLADANT